MQAFDRLLVTGHRGALERVCAGLTSRGHRLVQASVPQIEAAADASRRVILAVGEEAIESCRRIVDRVPGASVVVVDSRADLSRAIGALRAGAADYVPDLDQIDAVDAAVRRVVEQRALRDRLGLLDAEETETDGEPRLVGESAEVRDVNARIARLKNSDATVLVLGESGTGKEIVARVLHRTSNHRTGPFVAVNCGAIPSHLVESEFFGHARGAFTDASTARTGLLVQASRGTLFLDEVGALPLAAQAKLLRAIQERTVRPLGQGAEVHFDARILAASNLDLAAEVSRGRFRQDLYYRLNVVQILLPPLRERGLDTLLLAQFFIRRFAAASGKRVLGMTIGAARALLSYDFPGNVRELQNWMEAAVALCRHDHVTEQELVWHAHEVSARGHTVREPSLASWNALEARHIAAILEKVGGNKARAARLLGIDRKTLYRKLRRHGLAPGAALHVPVSESNEAHPVEANLLIRR